MKNRTSRPSSRHNNSSGGRKRSFSNSKSKFRSGGNKKRFSGNRNRGGNRRNSRGRGDSRVRRGKKMSTFDPSQFINKNPVDATEEIYTAKHTFETFGLDTRLVKNVSKMGIATPTPIQDQIIPEILQDRDVIGLAETGTGKTAAFLVPIVNKILQNNKQTTLILVPTRELAIQIQDELKKISDNLNIYSTVCVGGMPIRPQIRMLKKTNHFVIGTPGRILDLLKKKLIPLSLINTVVLDEADRMLDMGFINDMRTILSELKEERNTLLFSATMDDRTKNIVEEFLINPVTVSVKKKDVSNSIEQDVILYNRNNKFNTLLETLRKPEFKRVLVFGEMKHSVEKLTQELAQQNIEATSIHGNKNHAQRQKALKLFKDGKVQVLVATDVAARGIHVDNVTHVINYDLPSTREDYIHRIGRTGRGNKKGKSLTFISS